MRWQDALDLHIDYASFLVRGMTNRAIADEVDNFVFAFTPFEERDTFERGGPESQTYLLQLHNAVDLGYTTFVSKDVMSLIQAGAEELRELPDEALREHDLLPHGFIVFEEPLSYIDYDARWPEIMEPVSVRAIAWATVYGVSPESSWEPSRDEHGPKENHKGIQFNLLIDPPEQARLFKRTSWGGVMPIPAVEHNAYDRPLWITDMLPWAIGMRWHEENEGYNARNGTDVDASLKPHVDMFRRFMLSMFRFQEERILKEEILFPGKPGRKRWEHHKWSDRLDGERAKVLVLRRYEEEDRQPTDREIRGVMQKHIVRDHWRKFFCASRGLPVGHPDAYVWRKVDAYWRGDGPISDRKHPVTAVVR